jgi:hypothetical protein
MDLRARAMDRVWVVWFQSLQRSPASSPRRIPMVVADREPLLDQVAGDCERVGACWGIECCLGDVDVGGDGFGFGVGVSGGLPFLA